MRSLAGTRSVTVTATGLQLQDGTALRLHAGSVHYWRHDPTDWPRILDGIAALGFTCVDTYVPWSVHEEPDGDVVWTGSRDVTAFLRLADERGLHAVVRVGPHGACELTDSGFPARIHRDDEMLARRCNGLPYVLPTATHHILVPSYFSSRFREAVDDWYAQVCAQLAPLQHPDGPIVICQVDNEHGYFFQAHAYAMDYHPETLHAYRQFLRERHGDDIGGLNRAYETSHASFDDVDPPRDAGDLPELRRLEWIEWREEAIRITLGWLRSRLEAHGMDRVPFYHNDYPRTDTPMDQAALERSGAVDIAAADIYATRPGARYVGALVRHAAGTSRLPWLAELGTGWLTLPWLLPMAADPADTPFIALSGIASGARAFTCYMTAERDRWYGSPIDNHGGLREASAAGIREVLALLQRLRLEELTRDAPVLLLDNRAQGRRRAARATLGGLVPAFAGQIPFDFALTQLPDDGDARVDTWRRGVEQVLAERGVDHNRASTSTPPALDAYSCVFIPCAGGLDAATWEAISHTRAMVIIGPDAPRLDEHLRPLQGETPFTVIDDPRGAADLLPSVRVQAHHQAVDVHRWTGAGREVVFALNHSAEDVDFSLESGGPATLTPLWRDAEPLSVDAGGMIQTGLPAWGAQVWELSR